MATTEPAEAGTLIPELQECAGRFEAARDNVLTLVEGLSDDQFNWRPEPNRWSMAECVDHLCAIGNIVMPKLDGAIAGARDRGWTSQGPFRYGRIGNWFVYQVGPHSKRKFKAPPLFAPSSNHTQSRLVKAFAELQDEFVGRIHAANGLDLARIKMPSPATRLIRLSLGQWFALLAGHQERHLLQAEEVKSRLPA